ncbi:hypothetical protein PspLS_04350 [Pyricularia sp. CBS 133598]|nr:hypothetical protein PspLS_04350 [Pyricularia sp. CBS 133598]
MPPLTRSQRVTNSDATPYPLHDATSPQPAESIANGSICDQPLADLLRSAQVPSKWTETPGREFVPSKKLEELVTRDAVRAELEASQAQFKRGNLQKILSAVCGAPRDPQRASARQLFAILTLIGQAALIGAVIDEGITDQDLPLLYTRRRPGGHKLLCRRAPQGQGFIVCQSLERLQVLSQEAFDRTQYTIHVPWFRLSSACSPEIQHLTLDWSLTLPFVSDEYAAEAEYVVEDEHVAEDEHGYEAIFAAPSRSGNADSAASSGTRTGGFGEVRKIKIHPQQYNCQDFPTSERRNNCFALKILKADTSQEIFDRERTSLERLMAGPHANIVCLLGTMERQSDLLVNSRYYFIFPWADSNLHDFIKTKHPEPDDLNRDAALARWMARQMLGLAEALKLVHQSEGVGAMGMKHGRHGDIKPQNILWYRGPGDDMGTLKLADFGAAEFHSEHSVNVKADLAQHSPTHRAPEHDTSAFVTPRVDVWSLGAVLLELVVWYMCGYQGWQDFAEARSGEDDGVNVGSWIQLDKYFNVARRDGTPREASVKEAVHKQISDLRGHRLCSSYFSEVLDMIENQMLIIPFKDRILCRDLVQRFQTLSAKCQDSETFCTEPHYRRTAAMSNNSTPILLSPRTPEERPCLPAMVSNLGSFLSQPSAEGTWSSNRLSPSPMVGYQTPMTSRENTEEFDLLSAEQPAAPVVVVKAALRKSDSMPEDGPQHRGPPAGACLGTPSRDCTRLSPRGVVASFSSLRNELAVDGSLPVSSGRKRTNREAFDEKFLPNKIAKRETY